jgi:uncharacterized damage-inducible protein DinB
MKKLFLSILTFAVLAFAGVPRAASQPAQSAAPAQSADKTAPSYDMKAQALVDLDDMHKKFVGLATAVPQEKYTWRPADGVRSISEVFLHISAANYNIPTMLGTPAMPEYMAKDFDKSTTDKAKIIDQLNKSFEYAHSAIEKMSNADFAKPEKKLGPDANDGDVVYILVTHAHEHLGQSIAYARVNGIVPPWTAAAAAAAAAKKGQQPEE